MRQLRTVTLAAAVALVFANAAQAAVATNSSNNGFVMPTVQGTPTLRAQAATAPTSTGSGSGTTTTTGTTPATRTGNVAVDVRAQQTQNATEATHATGSTSANPLMLGSSSVNGSGTTSGTGTGTTSDTGTGTTSGVGVSGGVPFGTDFTTGIATNPNGMTSTAPIYAASDVVGGSSVMFDNTYAANTVTPAANGASVDRAIRAVANDRRRVGRNGQLLQTIAPRTNADRSREMPDDPLPASLTGSNSTLVR